MSLTLQGLDPDDRLRILKNGASLVMERTFPTNQRWRDNGGFHLHRHQDETFRVLEGILSVRIREELRTFVAGENFEIPKMSPHAICNQGSRPARIRWEVRPPMRTAEYLGAVYALRRRGRSRGWIERAAVDWAYREIVTPLSPLSWAQPVLLAALATAAYILGYRVSPPA